MERIRKWREALGRRKLNNKAMTLIEVIVAMAILAIVVTPTLRMFASSSGTNLRAKMRQRATTVGESVMESFKAYNVERLCQMFEYKTFTGVNGAADMGVEAFFTADRTPGAGTTWKHYDLTLDQEAQAYRFWVQGATAESSTYDIDIWVTPKSNPDVMNFESPNAYSDAIITLSENKIHERAVMQDGSDASVSMLLLWFQNKAKEEVTNAHGALSGFGIDDTTLSEVKRVIDVQINDNGTSQTVTMKLTYSCKAKVNYHYIASVGSAATSAVMEIDDSILTYEINFSDEADPTVCTIYDNSATIAGLDVNGKQCKLNNVFLYYFPDYDEVFGDDAEDEINISANLTGLYDNGGPDPKGYGREPLKVTVAKQLTTILSDSRLNNSEVNYEYHLNGSISGSGEMILLHNFNEKIKEDLASEPTPSSARISGFTEQKSIQEGILDKTNLIYDVEIKVYNAGTTDELATFTGTINE